MAERADPRIKGFKSNKSPYRKFLYERYGYCNQFSSGKVILDIPCGVGWGTSLVKNPKEICGVDICAEAVQYANDNYHGIIFKVGNMTEIPFEEGKFDLVLCLEGYEHIDQEKQVSFLGEAYRVLRDGGDMIITTPLGDGKKSKNPYHIHEPIQEELFDLLNKKFTIIDSSIVKGGDGDVIRCLVRK